MTDTEDEILFAQEGPIGVITLNRPKALNALTLGMIRALAPQMSAWAADDAVRAVVIRGGGEKAFCAGGDVRAVWAAGKALKAAGGYDPLTCDPDALPLRFFFEEYRLNRQIATYPKPYIALIDGVTMGGGIGLSVHGSRRIATEKTLAAMPETAIGLFPDVGATVALNRCPGKLGLHLALTGARLKGGADLLHAGFATHATAADRIDDIVPALAAAAWDDDDALATVDGVLAGLCADPGPSDLAALQGEIDRIYTQPDVAAVLAVLEATDTDFARETLETLRGRSPVSVMLAFAQLTRGADLPLEEALVTEYRLAQRCMAGDGFYEGIRAVLVDKDHAPQWQPARIEDVDPAAIEAYFAPLGARDLTFGDAA